MLRKTLLTTGILVGALTGTAEAGSLTRTDASTLRFNGSALDDTIDVTPVAGGLKFTSNQNILVQQSADSLCGPSSTTVVCSPPQAPISLEVDGDAGKDDIQIHDGVAGATDVDHWFIEGGDFDDVITGSSDAEKHVSGGMGADTIDLGAGNDVAHGDEGGDTILGGSGVDVLHGDGEDDVLFGGGSDDSIHGGGGADKLYGEGDDDLLLPGLGSDLVIEGGNDTGKGDTVSYADLPGPVEVSLSTTVGHDGMESETTEEAVGIENVRGTGEDDVLRGTNGANELDGLGGDDELTGYDGDDVLQDLSGRNVLWGGYGDDELTAIGTLNGGWDEDVLDAQGSLAVVDGGAGADVIHGGGAALLKNAGRTDRLFIDLTLPASTTQGGPEDDIDGVGPLTTRDTIDGVLHVEGGSGDDELKLAPAKFAVPATARGGEGADELTGSDVKDALHGGGGGDVIRPGAGADVVNGDGGDDTVQARDGGTADTIDCGAGTDDVNADGEDVTTLCETVRLPLVPEVVKQPTLEEPVLPVQTGGPTTPPTTTGTGTSTGLSPVPGRLVTSFSRSRRGTLVKRLQVAGAPKGARLTLRCIAPKGRKCPVRRVDATVKGATTSLLHRKMRGRRLAPGTRLEVVLTAGGRHAPRTMRVTIRRNARPLVATARG